MGFAPINQTDLFGRPLGTPAPTNVTGDFGPNGQATVNIDAIQSIQDPAARQAAINTARSINPNIQIPGVPDAGTGAATGGTGGIGTGGVPSIASEMDRDAQRGNLIGDAFQQRGTDALTNLGRLSDLQQQSGIATGGAFQDIGNANQATMASAAADANGTSNSFLAQGGQDQATSAMDRLSQIAVGGQAGQQGTDNFGNANQYSAMAAQSGQNLANQQNTQMAVGGQAGGAANSNFATSSAQMQNAAQNQTAQQGYQSQLGQQSNALGAQAGSNFGQAGTYGARASTDEQAQTIARLQQLGNAQQGAQYGAGNMGTSNAFLGGAGNDYAQQAASRANTQAAVGRLQDFYQQGPGPSAAEAQLKQSTDQNMANAISLARSGRGAGDNASAMRQAMFSNAATQQQAGMQGAQLRAQEASNWRGQQLQAMGQEQSTLGNLRAQDQSMYGQNVGAASQFAGLGYQGLGLGQQGATAARGQDLQSAGQNLQAQQAMTGLGYQGAGLQQQGTTTQGAQNLQQQAMNLQSGAQYAGLGYQGLGLNAQQANQVAGQMQNQQNAYLNQQNAQSALGYQGLGLDAQQANQARAQDLTSMQANNNLGLGYSQLGQSYQGLGLQNQQAMSGLANQQYMTSDQIAAAERQAAFQDQIAFTGLANDQYQQSDQLRNAQLLAQLSSDTSKYGADKNVSIAQAQMAQQRQAAQISAGGAILAGGMQMLSDIRAKENIQPADVTQTFGASAGNFGPKQPAGKKKRKPEGFLEKIFGLKDEGFDDNKGEDYSNAPYGLQEAPTAPKYGGSEVPLPGSPSWEQPISPFAQQAPAPQYAPDPVDPQRQVNIDFNQSPYAMSDERSKEDAFKMGAMFGKQQAAGPSPQTDLRPAQGYSYQYKNPDAPGAAPGRQFGPMAQDLEKTPAGASVVRTGPDGMKGIDTNRLSLVNTSAISEQQRRLDRLEQIAGRR